MTGMNGRIAALQIQGGRDYQEDAFGQVDGIDDRDDCCLLAVADGMGGHVGGDVASRIVVDTFLEIYPRASGIPPERLRSCLDAANVAITAAVADRPELDSMGSTAVVAAISGQELHWVSVGDSPMWIFRGGRLERINADHSMLPVLERMVEEGYMTEEEAARDSRRHMLRSVIIGDDIPHVDLSAEPVILEPDDRLLLASDGVLTLDERRIADILGRTHAATVQDAAEALIQAVEDAGHPRQDNTTVSLYEAAVS